MSNRARILSVLLVLTLVAAAGGPPGERLAAQGETRAAFGDPPVAALITLSEPDETGLVTIRGAEGSVFPGAVVAVRNLYTGQTVYSGANVNGAFTAQLWGPGNTPFWISPAQRIDPAERNVPGSLPGGPGVILYGPLPASYPELPAPPIESDLPETPVRIDGDAGEWADLLTAFPIDLGDGQGGLVYALANTESVYLALVPQSPDQPLPDDYAQLEVGLELDGRLFSVVIDPRRHQGGQAYAVGADGTAPDYDASLGPLDGLSAQQTAIEVRLPRLAFTGGAAPITLRWLRWMTGVCCGAEWIAAPAVDLFLPVEERDEVDKRAVEPLTMPREAVLFTLAGPVGGGSGQWSAQGWVNALSFAPGDTLLLEMQVTMTAPAMPGDGSELRLGASLRLEPVIAASGAQTAADRVTGNGWSGILTPTGLAVENVPGGVVLGDASAQNLIIADDTLTFVLQWALPVSDDLPEGLYVPALDGHAAVTGVVNTWDEAGLLGDGPGAGVAESRLPLVLQVGDPAGRRLLWTLFQDQPSSSGGRGILAEEDAGTVALSNRVAFNAERYVLPRLDPRTGEPIPYPLEPYLPAVLGNSFFESVAPLVPFAFESGELAVTVTRPDGTVDDLGSAPLAQNRLSTPTRLESEALGATSPVDVYRLTTLDPRFTAYTFQQDGLHTIHMIGTIRDVWGHEYTGGGTYRVWLAEPFQMMPGVLPGTPFEVGDAFNPALTVAPAFPAEVSTRLRVFPLDGGDPVEYTLEGTANAYGCFQPDRRTAPWIMTTPGEYVVDVTATYTDPLGRLWMGSVRGAGVVASPEGSLVVRGGRGLANVPAEDRLAWYALDHTAPDVLEADPDAHLRWPYYSGDVLWSRDGTGSLEAVLRVTDVAGDYQSWLLNHVRGWRADDGLTLGESANEDELPLLTVGPAGAAVGPGLRSESIVNRAYAYFSAVRPGLSVRQLVLGGEPSDLAQPGWNFDDPYNAQRGAGVNGDLPGDYTLLFGGVVIHNEELDLHQAAIYGALAITIDLEDERGDRVYPPFRGAANGPDGGPLLTVRGVPLEMFFVPTGFRPGQVFTVGETLALSGQVAPALAARVEADLVMPSGRVLPIIGRANAVGYFYDPAQNLILSEAGIWRVRVRVIGDGMTSAGPVQEPYPTGGVPGAETGEFEIYVLPEDAPAITLRNRTVPDEMVSPAYAFNLTVDIPADWTGVQAAYTVAMPGLILERGVQAAPGDTFTYTYDPRRLNRTFPNLDIRLGETQNPLSVDTVLVTLALSGLDAAGEPVMAARTVTLFGDRLLILDDNWPAAE